MAYTGLPTIAGWGVHEWLWRGSYDFVSKRLPDIQAIYESKDDDLTQTLLSKYQVKYVFIGTLEYEKYPNLNLTKFEKLGKIIFQKDKTKIYQIN